MHADGLRSGQPSPEAVERATLTRFTRWLEDTRGLSLRRLRGAVALVGRRARGLLGVDLGVLRRACAHALRARARAPRDARRAVVHGRRAQLRRARLLGAGRRGETAIVARSDAARDGELSWDELRDQVARVGGRAARRSASARRPRRRLHAEHPRDGRRVPGHREPRRDLVELLRPSSARAAWSTASPRSSPRCCSRSTATATAAATSTAARSSPGCSARAADPRAHGRRCPTSARGRARAAR